MSETEQTRKLKTAKGNWECSICKLMFRTRSEMFTHKHQEHQIPSNKWEICNGKRKLVSGHIWNKGLNVTDERVQKIVETTRSRGGYTLWKLGKHLSEEHKNAISQGMKQAHKENRAHNIGASRWNNKHSWPEEWFITMLHAELNMVEHDDYKTELPFGKYSLDFAWPETKRCIEIDGEQHERFDDYKKRDAEKDRLLHDAGWQVLRIKWKDCFHNPQQYIEQVKKFILG